MLLMFVAVCGSNGQTRKLAWADEFNGAEIDRSNWSFDSGPTNDNIHFYTDRAENARIADGKLRIIALKESYRGFNYTSALLKTSGSFGFRYGRVEARIKLPGTPGFVPAFWMLPSDNIYGWWPLSGEIDVMEYPTTEGGRIYGTVHTQAYNLFSGDAPRGGSIPVQNAESEFHLYAVEWSGEKIDFYVDDTKYYSFVNNHGKFDTWPFNQPFDIILNLAVGGGWVGAPGQKTIFPAVMEIDYVRVYQAEGDMAVNGPDYLPYNSSSVSYSFPEIDGARYSWDLPGHGSVISGQNTSRILTAWNFFGGTIRTRVQTDEGLLELEHPVNVSHNLIQNPGFEKGVKYWSSGTSVPAKAEYSPDTLVRHGGKSSLRVHVKTSGTNAWDVQVSQRGFSIERGKKYHASFWAKTEGAQGQLNAAIINAGDYTPYAVKTLALTDSWTLFQLDLPATTNAPVALNVDLGSAAGIYHLDDFVFTTPELSGANQLKDADFESDSGDWIFQTFPPAQAGGSVENGRFAVSINNGGVNAWDVHLGQTGVSVEKSREYTVSFDAYAEEPRAISVIVGRNSAPWTVYSGNRSFDLTTTPQTFTFAFIMTEPSDPSARFGFDIGASPVGLHFDNVLLSGGKTPSDVARNPEAAPADFLLTQNYPNPFNPGTTVTFELPGYSQVDLSVYDTSGRLVKTLLRAGVHSGRHEVDWDGTNSAGNPVASGIYFCRLSANGRVGTRRMVMMR